MLKRKLGGPAEAEDTVVRLLGREALESGLDVLVLFVDQVIVAVFRSRLVKADSS